MEVYSPDELNYNTYIKFYEEYNGSHPFELMVESKGDYKFQNIILFSEQCKNVKISPQKSEIYIFYDKIILENFSSSRYDSLMPTPILCDMSHSYCRGVLHSIIEKGGFVKSVCLLRSGALSGRLK